MNLTAAAVTHMVGLMGDSALTAHVSLRLSTPEELKSRGQMFPTKLTDDGIAVVVNAHIKAGRPLFSLPCGW